jgi:hypothetical protein
MQRHLRAAKEIGHRARVDEVGFDAAHVEREIGQHRVTDFGEEV